MRTFEVICKLVFFPVKLMFWMMMAVLAIIGFFLAIIVKL